VTNPSPLPNTSLLHRARTKTVATIGPASASPEMLAKLFQAGVDVVRLNMAHGTRTEHELALKHVRAASIETGIPVAILVDLAGPKIRLGQLFEEPLVLENDDVVKFVRGGNSHKREELTCGYETLIDEVAIGDEIVLADGMARLKSIHKTGDELHCIVVDGGRVRSRQGVNLPGTVLSIPSLGTVDIENAIWAAAQGANFVSISFVRNADEVKQLKKILTDQNSTAGVVAKIEKKEALEQLDAIVATADVIMVARGDLGVEIAIEKTPAAQKRIIRTCLKHRKPVIVATQMLESMHTSKQPTRAEVTDVANAILDGADACMLSGETAIGEYPVDAVKMMNKIMCETEKSFDGCKSKMTAYERDERWEVSDAVILGAAQIARRISAKMLVIASEHGLVAMLKSKQRDYIPTVCFTDQASTLQQMCLYWGVLPVFIAPDQSSIPMQTLINDWSKINTELKSGDPYVVITDTEVFPGIHDSVLVAQIL
jgi:pyruvate kinase